jgi:hypothetical protein
MHETAEAHDTPRRMLRDVPWLGLGTTDQVRACALAGTVPPSNTSPVSTAPTGNVLLASAQRRARPRAAPPRAWKEILFTGIDRRFSAIAVSLC